MGKKAYMGPMQDPNGINAQILPIWVPYIHVCWVGIRDNGSRLYLNRRAFVMELNATLLSTAFFFFFFFFFFSLFLRGPLFRS